MKLLLDQNLSYKLISVLEKEFPGSAHVRDVGLATANDLAIWEYAGRFGFTIVSKDTDFSQRSFLFGPPPKVIWIRLGNCSTQQIGSILRLYSSEIQQFESDTDTSFLVIDPLLEAFIDEESPAKKPTRIPIESRTISSISYDSESQILEIEFKPSGEIHRYFAVPTSEYERLINASSKMAYLNTQIRSNYRFQKIL